MIENASAFAPVAKMKITVTKQSGKETFTVLYNPESYTRTRSTKYAENSGDKAPKQYVAGALESVSFDLFFDTFNSGIEAGGIVDSIKLEVNSLLPSFGKISVKTYTDKVYKLLEVDGDTHAPPVCFLEWGELQFNCVLVSCEQTFTKFNEMGKAVRARLSCRFEEYKAVGESSLKIVNNSPDTSKFHTVKAGDSLWSLAEIAYSDCSSWRIIANANNLANPRCLRSGATLRMPAQV